MTRQAVVEHDATVGAAVRCSPRRCRSSATSRSATGAPSAGRSRTPTPRRSCRRSRSRSTPSSRSPGPSGTRRVPAAEFFVGTWTTTLEPEELLDRGALPGVGRRCRVRGRRGRPAQRRLRPRRRRLRGRARRRGRGRRSAIGLVGMGPTPCAHATPRPALNGSVARARPTSKRSDASRSATPNRPTTCTRRPSTGSTSARTSWSAPSTEHWERHGVAEHEITLTVNGERARRPRRRRARRSPTSSARTARSRARTSGASTACAARAPCSSTARRCARA